MDMILPSNGINLGGWFSHFDFIREKSPETLKSVDQHIKNYITDNDIEYLKESGYQHVRIPLDYRNFFTLEGHLLSVGRIEFLKNSIEMILRKDLTVILDLHESPGHSSITGEWETQWFFVDEESRKITFKIWKQLAEFFSFDKRIFFELLNEPVAPQNKIWDSVKNDFVMTVREFAPNQTFLIGSNKWSQVYNFSELTPVPDDDNIVYCFHFYNPLIFTHQRAPWMDNPEFLHIREYPGTYLPFSEPGGRVSLSNYGTWNKSRLKEALQPVLDWREKYQRPVLCNEFGVYPQSPRDSQLQYIEDLLSIFEEEEIGWTYWNYKNLDFGLISDSEPIHYDLPQFQNPRRFDRELAKLLSAAAYGDKSEQEKGPGLLRGRSEEIMSKA